MDKQQVFDKVAKHLLTQQAKSIEDDECRYRTASGLMCAVGCLIPANISTDILEGCNVHVFMPEDGTRPFTVDELKQLAKAGITADNLDLLRQLQLIHDTRPVDAWPHHLQKVAGEFKLSSEVLHDFS